MLKEIGFRYTDHRPYSLAGALLFVGFLLAGAGLLRLWGGILRPLTGRLGEMGTGGIPYLIVAFGCLALGVWCCYGLSHSISRRLFDRQGVACFFPQSVVIHKGGKTFSREYADIQVTHRHRALEEDGGSKVSGPLYLQVVIKAKGETLVLGASVRETDQAWGGFWSNWKRDPACPPTSLNDVLEELLRQTGPGGERLT